MLCAYMKINNKTCKINKCRKITTTRRKPYFTADGLFHIFRQENISHGASRISLRRKAPCASCPRPTIDKHQ